MLLYKMKMRSILTRCYRVRRSSMMWKPFRRRTLRQRRLRIEKVGINIRRWILSHLNRRKGSSMRWRISLKRDEFQDLRRNFSSRQLTRSRGKLRKRFWMGLHLTDCIKKPSMTKTWLKTRSFSKKSKKLIKKRSNQMQFSTSISTTENASSKNPESEKTWFTVKQALKNEELRKRNSKSTPLNPTSTKSQNNLRDLTKVH